MNDSIRMINIEREFHLESITTDYIEITKRNTAGILKYATIYDRWNVM